jgi:hypothetical protein
MTAQTKIDFNGFARTKLAKPVYWFVFAILIAISCLYISQLILFVSDGRINWKDVFHLVELWETGERATSIVLPVVLNLVVIFIYYGLKAILVLYCLYLHFSGQRLIALIASSIVLLHACFFVASGIFILTDGLYNSIESHLGNAFLVVISLSTIESFKRYFTWTSLYHKGKQKRLFNLHNVPTNWVIATTSFCWGIVLVGITYFELLELG